MKFFFLSATVFTYYRALSQEHSLKMGISRKAGKLPGKIFVSKYIVIAGCCSVTVGLPSLTAPPPPQSGACYFLGVNSTLIFRSFIQRTLSVYIVVALAPCLSLLYVISLLCLVAIMLSPFCPVAILLRLPLFSLVAVPIP